MKKVKLVVDIDVDKNININWIIGKLIRSMQGETGVSLIETVVVNEDSKES